MIKIGVNVFLIFVIVVSCNTDYKKTPFYYTVNKALIKSNIEFLFPDGGEIDEEYGSVQQFEKQNLKITYLTDTIFAEAVIAVNSCGKAIAEIKFSKDSLVLTTIETKELLCNSLEWYKYQYWIANPKNKKFVVTQD